MSNQALYFSFKNGFGSTPKESLDLSMNLTDFSPSPQISNYPISGLSSPCKEALDFSEIIKSNKLDKSKLSTNDSFSIRTDDDMSKSISSFDSLSGEVIFKNKPKGRKTPPEEQTLKEIISKRVYIKGAKNLGNGSSDSSQNSNKRRNPNLDSSDSEESITKKEKREEDAMHLFNSQGGQKPFVPQVIFKDGKVQLDLSPQEEAVQKPVLVVAGNQKKVTTSRSFKKISNTEKWSEYDTRKFYRALEFFGTDFSTIGKLFKNRSHNQIKNKFLKEEKVAPEKIDAVFSKSKTANFGALIELYKKTVLLNKSTGNSLTIGENLLHVKREKSETSQSDILSLDSVDISIMEDLADIFLPPRQQGILGDLKKSVKIEECLSFTAKLL